MIQNDNNTGNQGTISWGKKLGYIGTGVVIGIVIYPFVKKTIAKVQPKLDEWLDDLTGKAEGFAEKATDLVSTVRGRFNGNGNGSESGNGHDHDHEHDHVHSHGTAGERKKAAAKSMAEKFSGTQKS